MMTTKNTFMKHAINNGLLNNNSTAIGVMDFDGLEKTVKELFTAFPDNFQHSFAVKANPLIQVLTELRELGMEAEVASEGELAIAEKAGFESEQIIYDSPSKTRQNLEYSIKNNISLNIDNLQELDRVADLMKLYPESQSMVGMRINPQMGAGSITSTSTATATSKFGYALNDNNNRDTLLDCYKIYPWLNSIHIHSGSQGIPLDKLVDGIQLITDFAEEVNNTLKVHQIKRIDIGGGLPVNFDSEEVKPTFADYATLLSSKVPILFSDKYEVKTEFGRTIVAKNGFMVSRVEYTKISGGRLIASTHTGAQVATRSAFLPKSWPLRVSCYAQDGELKTVESTPLVQTDIAGPCCFAADMICTDRTLPTLEQDDYILIHDTGGYYFSNHFEYNTLPRLAVYKMKILDEKLQLQCIRKADTVSDLISKM